MTYDSCCRTFRYVIARQVIRPKVVKNSYLGLGHGHIALSWQRLVIFSGNYSLEHISIIGRSVDSNGKKPSETDFEALTSGDDLPPPPSGKRKVIVAQRPNSFLWTLKVTSSRPGSLSFIPFLFFIYFISSFLSQRELDWNLRKQAAWQGCYSCRPWPHIPSFFLSLGPKVTRRHLFLNGIL